MRRSGFERWVAKYTRRFLSLALKIVLFAVFLVTVNTLCCAGCIGLTTKRAVDNIDFQVPEIIKQIDAESEKDWSDLGGGKPSSSSNTNKQKHEKGKK